jgi:PAS domain S-box-containing protein
VASYFAKVALLAALYFLTGKLGLSLALPPGYATIIWPPSGLVLGFLLLFGRQYVPGVFVGSFVLNLTVGHLPHELPTASEALIAACIAAGSSLQALLGHGLIVKWFGVPVRLRSLATIGKLLLVAGPLTCLVSATIGVTTLHAFGNVPRVELVSNWITWWSGDVFGVLVFLPLMLVLPVQQSLVTWRGRPVRGIHAISVLLLVLPLGLTFYAWRSLAESGYTQGQAHFENLAKESEQALQTRLAAYASATRGGTGVFQSSEFVSRDEWRTFTEALRLQEDYPGVLGLGWIEQVTVERGAPSYVVTYIEPELANAEALGLKLEAVPGIREAAERAVATGMPALSRAVRLWREEEAAPGFLLLQPVFRTDQPLNSGELRRRALRGFVYAPFTARGFLTGLTPSQGRRIDVTLSETGPDAGEALFSSRVSGDPARFSVRREIAAFGQTWTVLWQSTPEFESGEGRTGAHFVLFGGLLFTGLFAVLLMVFSARRQSGEASESPVQPWFLPVATFVLVAGGSFAGYALLSGREDAGIGSELENEVRRVEAHLDRSIRQRLQAVRRMAHRWSSGGGTPYVVWRNDARDLLRQIEGLDELRWIGPDYHVQWAEGSRRRGWAEQIDIRTSTDFTRAIAASADQGSAHVTGPREYAPGESAFEVYVPLTREGRFDGFLAGTFTSQGFFRDSPDATAGSEFAFTVRHGDAIHFDNGAVGVSHPEWSRESSFRIGSQTWSFTLRPTAHFVDARQTLLPMIVLCSGLLIAFLSAALVRFVLAARHEALRLQASTRALSASEKRYELVLRGMSVGLWDWDTRTHDVFLSPRCKDILRIKDGDVSPSYQGFMGRLHPEDKPRVEKALFAHLKQEQPFDLEFRIRRNDGDHVWVHIYGQAQYDPDGFANRMVGSMQDITAQMQQALELERSRARLRLLIENTPAAVAMFDAEMRYIMSSHRWVQDYGLEGQEIIGRSHYDVFPEIRGMQRWLDVHQRALRGERFDIREDSWVRADGQTEWIQWAIHPWMDADGRVGGIVMFTEVITARKLAEVAHSRAEAMNRAALDKAPIGVALVRPDGHFIRVNPAMCQMLGYTERELLQRDFQSITHPDDLVQDLANFRDLLEARVARYQLEKRYFHRDGRVIWGLVSVSLVRRASGEVDFAVAQVQDVTERKMLENMKDEFVTVVSRELREPLAAICGALDEIAALRATGLPEPMQDLINVCAGNSDRLSSLVEGLLDLERIAAGQARFEFHDEPVAEITRQAVLANEMVADDFGVRLEIADIDRDLMVYVDPRRYEQALSHLLSNAVKFSPPGGVVDVGAELRGDWVRIHVRDRGEGIPEEFRARIFGKFSHAATSAGQRKGGAGLGLYLTRQLVEHMRGKVGFSSQVGEGSTFWVEFPRIVSDQRRQIAG